MKDRLIVALDVPDLKKAESLVKELSGTVKIFKVGKELFTASGPEAVHMIQKYGGEVFLDLKFHDIPNTVYGAVKQAASLGVFMTNVHVMGGRQMMIKAKEALLGSQTKASQRKIMLLGVTILTSMNDESLREIGIANHVEDEVVHLATLARDCGLDGVVASPKEVPLIRKACGREFVIVTPGVRPSWAAKDDQERISTPKDAIQNGADYLVVGRPITAAKNPKESAEKVLHEL